MVGNSKLTDELSLQTWMHSNDRSLISLHFTFDTGSDDSIPIRAQSDQYNV